MLSNGFEKNECDNCVYIKQTPQAYVIVCLYIDDVLIMVDSHKIIINTKKILTKYFEMKDLGVADVILGINTSEEIILFQPHYIKSILER